jgi:hypothetical protein
MSGLRLSACDRCTPRERSARVGGGWGVGVGGGGPKDLPFSPILSLFYGLRCCDKSNRPRDAIERPPALPCDSLYQLFEAIGNMDSDDLVSAASGCCWLGPRRRNSAGVGDKGGGTPPDMRALAERPPSAGHA